MKYIITRHFSIKKEKYEVVSGSKTVCAVKARPSKEYKGQFNVKLSSSVSKKIENETCIVEPDPDHTQNYFIYIFNDNTNEKTLFGQLYYEASSYDNYLYTIIIGRKLYKVRSCDLKDRHLAIIDKLEPSNSPSSSKQNSTIQGPETLFQVIDSFSKVNKTYHVTINDKEKQLGYLAIIVLLDLHECRRD